MFALASVLSDASYQLNLFLLWSPTKLPNARGNGRGLIEQRSVGGVALKTGTLLDVTVRVYLKVLDSVSLWYLSK